MPVVAADAEDKTQVIATRGCGTRLAGRRDQAMLRLGASVEAAVGQAVALTEKIPVAVQAGLLCGGQGKLFEHGDQRWRLILFEAAGQAAMDITGATL
jgi:hypothetical protein